MVFCFCSARPLPLSGGEWLLAVGRKNHGAGVQTELGGRARMSLLLLRGESGVWNRYMFGIDACLQSRAVISSHPSMQVLGRCSLFVSRFCWSAEPHAVTVEFLHVTAR
jgi:hypothetical protein